MTETLQTDGLLLALEVRGRALARCRWTSVMECVPPQSHEEEAIMNSVMRQLREYLAGSLRKFNIPLYPAATEFQNRIRRQLLAIPYGCTATYGQIAASIGCPGGARAVAGACARNPFPVIVPCHRVIGSDGAIGGYTAMGTSSATHIKLHLLALEQKFCSVGGIF